MAGSGNASYPIQLKFQGMVLVEPRMVFSIFALPGARANGLYGFQWFFFSRQCRNVATWRYGRPWVVLAISIGIPWSTQEYQKDP